MMTTDPAESSTILQSAVEALKRGDKVAAQNLAQQAASLAPETEAPWLILAALASPDESLDYVRKALQINPDSRAANQALDWVLKRLPVRPPGVEGEQPSAEIHSEDAAAEQPSEPVQPAGAPAEPPAGAIHPLEAAAEQPPQQVGAAEAEQPPEEIRPVDQSAEQVSEETALPASLAGSPAPQPAQRKKSRLSPALIIVIVVVVLLAVAVYAGLNLLQP
jgi:hypothetical protein